MKMHRLVLILEIEAETVYDAEDIAREHVRPFKQLVKAVFVSKDKKPQGWLGAVLSQLLGK